MQEIRHILVATRFDDASLHAQDIAVRLASALGARMTLLHVYNVPGTPVLSLEDLAARAERGLREAAAELAPKHPHVSITLRRGAAATEILAVTAELEVDLLVLGTHGRRGLDRVMLGSVAEHVVKYAHVPVLTVGPAR